MLLKFYLPYCQYYTVVNLDVNSFENYITNCILLELNNSLLPSVLHNMSLVTMRGSFVLFVNNNNTCHAFLI